MLTSMPHRQRHSGKQDNGREHDPGLDEAVPADGRGAIAAALEAALLHLRKAVELASDGEYPEASMVIGSAQVHAESALQDAHRALFALEAHPLPALSR